MTSIRQRLTWKLLLTFGFFLALGGLGVFLGTLAELLEEFDHDLRDRAMALVLVTTERDGQIEINSTGQFMRPFDAIINRKEQNERAGRPDQSGKKSGHWLQHAFFQMQRSDGAILKRSDSLDGTALPFRVPVGKPQFWNLTLPSGSSGRAVSLKFKPQSAEKTAKSSSAPAELVLTLARDRHDLDESITTLAVALAILAAGLLSTTFVAVPRLLRHELAPLDKLAEQTKQINADSLAIRFCTESLPRELAPIARGLNDLLTRLGKSFERERQFSADVAHELRTPIAELRSVAELALKWPELRHAGTDSEVLAIALQMEGIVVRLLALLRSGNGEVPVKAERIELAQLVRQAWRPFDGRAANKDLQITCDLQRNAEVDTDPVLLQCILNNLLDNAVEYTPRGGCVRIQGEVTEEQHFTLRVTNTVDHLTADELPKLFERFWRQDLARSGNEHSGLGLSLASAFAGALRCELVATLDDKSRLTLTLSPLA